MAGTTTRVVLGVAGAAVALTLQGSVSLRGAGGCGLQKNDAPVAFCETFDRAFPVTNRSGQLDGTLWGVSRITGNLTGGTGWMDEWSPSTLVGCAGPQPAQPDATDVIVCNGQLRETTDDNENVTVLAIYPKQPFDFAGRTGTVGFDVSNDTSGTHGYWPEFWISDQPVPAPFMHGEPLLPTDPPCDFCSLPRNGIGINFADVFDPQQGGQAPNCPTDANVRWAIDEVIVVRNYALEKIPMLGANGRQSLGCVIAASGPNGPLNHVEVRVNANQIEVWATDAGSSVLKIMSRTTLTTPLTFTRGLIWLEDAHYNATKCGRPVQCSTNHTFTWDNVAFDGPAPYRDVSVDVPDHLTRNGDGTLNLGWDTGAGPVTLNTLPFSAGEIALATAANRGALLMFNYSSGIVATFNYTINGHPLTAPPPVFPLTQDTNFHSVALPIPFAYLVPGPQTVTLSANKPIQFENVNIVLIAGASAPGQYPVPPTNLRILR